MFKKTGQGQVIEKPKTVKEAKKAKEEEQKKKDK
jgi:hypothetical protein